MALTESEALELAELEELERLEKEIGSKVPREPGSSQAQAILEAGAQGLTGRYLPQLQAGAEQVMFPVMNVLTGQEIEADPYAQARDLNIQRMEQQRQDFPVSTTVAELGGGLAQGFAIPSAGLAKGAGVLKTAATGAGTGALFGALQNPGDVQGEVSPLQVKERAMAAGTGALLGGGIGAVAGGIGRAGPKAADLAEDFASQSREKAYKAFGPQKAQVRQAMAKPGGIEELGEVAKRRGLLKGSPKDYDELAEAALKEKEAVGAEIGGMIDQIDKAVKDVSRMRGGTDPSYNLPALLNAKVSDFASRAGLDRKAIAQAIENELKGAPGVPGTQARNEMLSELVKEFEQGGSLIGIKDAQALKEAVAKEINWKRLPGQDIPDKEVFYRALYSKLKTGIEDSAEAASDLLGDKAREAYIRAKKDYGALSLLEKTARNRSAGDFANRVASMSDYQSGQAGAVLGAMAEGANPLLGAAKGAVAAGVTNQIARRFGPQGQSKLYQGMSDLLNRFPNASTDFIESFAQRTAPTAIQQTKKRRLKALED